MDVTVKTDAGDLFRGIGSKPRVRQGLEVLKRRDRRHRSTPHGCGRCFFFFNCRQLPIPFGNCKAIDDKLIKSMK